MNWTKTIFYIVLISCFPIGISAQSINVDDTKDVIELVQVLTNNNSCLSVSSQKSTGATNKKSIAYFDKNGTNFPFSNGVVLSTWESQNSKGPYNPSFSGTVSSWGGDSNMDAILGVNSSNATTLEFEFESKTNFLSFNYIFASNEYIRDFPCNYSDGLAILIQDITSNGNYINIATLPDGTPVSSKDIRPRINLPDPTLAKCDAKNEMYFEKFNTDLTIPSPINYAGQTKVLNAQSKLEIGHRYRIKFVIAEGPSRSQFSALFIEAGSFASKIDLGKDRLISTKNAICNGETVAVTTGLTGAHKWFKTDSSTPIQLTETSNNLAIIEQGTYKVEVINSGCTFTGEIKIEYAAGMNLKDVELAKCDDNGTGTAVFDLTAVQNVIVNNDKETSISGFYTDADLTFEITNPKAFEKTTIGNQVVYVKGINPKFTCFETATITLKTLPSTQNRASEPNPIIKEFTGGKNSIELITSGTTSNLEFSIDGINYQENSLFTDVPKGKYFAYIRNTTNCEFISFPFTILDYPTFFTPNGDGINDEWKISDMDKFPKSVVYIFDRYGKLLKQMNANSMGWNGTLNGLSLPADDYWFRLILNDNQIVNGHFSLKR
jgi:gliding motility-associated-like protein